MRYSRRQGISGRRALGSEGEALAAAHLAQLGFEVLSRNVRSPVGEIDLVARKGEELHFVEVKCRGSGSLMTSDETVLPQQIKRIRKAAEWYLRQHEREWKRLPSCSFGVVAIDSDENEERRIEYIEDAF